MRRSSLDLLAAFLLITMEVAGVLEEKYFPDSVICLELVKFSQQFSVRYLCCDTIWLLMSFVIVVMSFHASGRKMTTATCRVVSRVVVAPAVGVLMVDYAVLKPRAIKPGAAGNYDFRKL